MKKTILILTISFMFLAGCADNGLNNQSAGIKNSNKISTTGVIPRSNEVVANKPAATQEILTKSETATNTQAVTQKASTDEVKKVENTGHPLFQVTRVVDGDTIEIEGGEKVRYTGIDTPETVHPSKPVQCFGKEASNKNKELVEGKKVRLEKDITDKDKYGRLLRYVYVDDIFVNLELVKQGYAYSYTYPPDVKFQDMLVKAQQEAREKKLGLWGSCQTDTATPVAPTNTKTTNTNISNPPASATPEEKNCVIKGNINDKKEKIYHLPGCGSYSKTQIDESKGEKWFCSEAEATTAGWRKALNCQ